MTIKRWPKDLIFKINGQVFEPSNEFNYDLGNAKDKDSVSFCESCWAKLMKFVDEANEKTNGS